MDKKYILLLPLLLSPLVLAEDITVYTWVDEKGIVHYEQNQPIEKDYSELKIKPNKPSSNLTQNAKDLTEEERSKAEAAVRCTTAKDNLDTLSGFANIEVDEGNGKTRRLSEKEKRQQLELTQKQVDVYCKL